MKNLIKPIIVLTAIAFVCTAALSGVNSLTSEIIAKAAAEKKAATMQELFPGEQGFDVVEIDAETLNTYASSGVYKAASGKGYIVEVAPAGYGGEIKMMVAFNNECEVLKVKILEHAETSGIGTRVVGDEDYLSQYVGKNAKNPEGVDAISGATISSKAVLSGINNAMNLITSPAMAAEQ